MVESEEGSIGYRSDLLSHIYCHVITYFHLLIFFFINATLLLKDNKYFEIFTERTDCRDRKDFNRRSYRHFLLHAIVGFM